MDQNNPVVVPTDLAKTVPITSPVERKDISLTPVVKALEDAYNHFRKSIYNDGIKGNVLITVQSKGRRNAYGWFAPDRWKAGETLVHEINISAEYLQRDPKDVLLTVAHEGLHHYCREKEIKDTSNNGSYHNKKFRAEAVNFGYTVPEKPDPRIGFSGITFGTNAKAMDSLPVGILETLKDSMARLEKVPGKAGKKGNMYLYLCPCGVKARVGHDHANLRCDDCGEPFECQDA
jgi:hypothetical protein